MAVAPVCGLVQKNMVVSPELWKVFEHRVYRNYPPLKGGLFLQNLVPVDLDNIASSGRALSQSTCVFVSGPAIHNKAQYITLRS